MNKLLTGFATEAECMALSQSLYTAPEGSVTRYLVGWKQHPQTLEWALVVPPGYEQHFTAEQQAALVDDEWPFPAPEE